ncbi:MAG: Ppx/GppA phosphatase family protein, partial [Alicyclobacillaceae bacterium]|nr:Ppx/GppA phosphatase family protein [Alicyclobacillaceae bacterium]
NSVRLVIYQQGPHGTQREVDNLKQTVRLSSHLTPDNVITEKGIQLTVRVLGQFKQLCDAYGVTEIVGVATQAVRAAENRDELLNRVFEETGIRFRVVSGEEEARYGYLAVVNSIPLEEGVTVDVGGGSTEITYFRRRRLVHWASIPLGAVSLTREWIRSDPPSPKEMKELERAIRDRLDQCPWLEGLRCPVIGMGGTARSIARVHQRRRHYPLHLLHGYKMWPTEVTAILDMVRSVPLEKRGDIDGLSADRADIIVAGAAMLDQVLKRVEATHFVISNKGLRDGILMEEVLRARGQDLLPDMLMYSIENIHDHFRLNAEHAFHVWRLADGLFSAMVKHRWLPGGEEARRWLQVAALLHDIGRTISIYNASKHTFYLLLQVPLFGISHRDRILAAAIASFKTTKQIHAVLANYQEFLRDEDAATIARLGVLLRLARALDRTETGVVQSADLLRSGKNWKILIRAERPLGLELDLASEWLKKWRKVFQREIRLEVDQLDRAERV